MPVVGFLHSSSPEAQADVVAAFRKGLSEAGYVEGQNVTIEYRWAHNDNKRLPELAVELVRRRVAVIAAPLGTPAALAAKAATITIPIVFGTGGDPVQAGLVASFNRPGGNVTGISTMNAELEAKRLGLLQETVPGASRFAVLVNPDNPINASVVANLKTAASAIGRQIEVLTAAANREIDSAFVNLVQNRIDALMVSPDQMFFSRRVQLVTLATRHAVPTMYTSREFTEVGGLMSYGPNIADIFRQVGVYTGRILKGAKPADLPVMQPTKFDFILNLQTAKTLRLAIPPTLLAIADEVIE